MMLRVCHYANMLWKVALAVACATMVILWPNWRVALSTETYYQGRMTGGGSILCQDAVTGTEFQVRHGFELHCKPEGEPVPLPNNLEVNWGVGENFHLTRLVTAVCRDDPDIGESPPQAGFDTMVATGTGTFNNEEGFTIAFTFTDAGEPGAGVDTASFVIFDASGTVLECESTVLEQGGNHQAHKATGNQRR